MNSIENIGAPLIDSRFNIMSYEQYKKDLKTKKFTKMCMNEIINADIMIATFGEEKYFKSSSEILGAGNVAYQQMGLDKIIYVYVNTYKNFMAVANDDMSDEDFLKLMKGFHEQYELITSQQTGLAGISRFILAFGDNLIDQVKSACYMNSHLQNNFIVATDERERLAAKTEKNLELFDLLNYAINNDKVIPYYQGIYNNEEEKITKYEALMRIADKDGKIYPPGMFLDAAKVLKLYLPISKIMINKALKDFEHKNCELGINISLFDIQSEEFKKWFIQRLKAHPDPSKVIVEFVETENYNDNQDQVVNFLVEIRKLGCKIAVDDFGVGFATYTSIVSLKPDIIKIDGDIIKNLKQNSENKIILDSICYMAKLIGSKIVAEFVETKDIQDILVSRFVEFSQGYYFAKPQPLEELNVE